MKVNVQADGSVNVEGEGTNAVEAFRDLAQAQEVFNHSECGCCKKKKIKFTVRQASSGKKEFEYFELRCENFDCRAKLSFGHAEGGVLYPKKKYGQLSESEQEQRSDEEAYADKHYGFLPNGGWYKYKKKD